MALQLLVCLDKAFEQVGFIGVTVQTESFALSAMPLILHLIEVLYGFGNVAVALVNPTRYFLILSNESKVVRLPTGGVAHGIDDVLPNRGFSSWPRKRRRWFSSG